MVIIVDVTEPAKIWIRRIWICHTITDSSVKPS